MLTYNDLYEILRKEKYSDSLQQLPKNFVDFRSEFFGAVSLSIGSFLEPNEIILGVKFIETTKAPIEGRLGESTASLMQRRERKLAINNTHDREGIEASLINIDGVIDALVLENNTNELEYDPRS